jgi:hypothetical protein
MNFSFACISLLLAPVFITAKLSGTSVNKYKHQLDERHLAGRESVARRLDASEDANVALEKMKENLHVQGSQAETARLNAATKSADLEWKESELVAAISENQGEEQVGKLMSEVQADKIALDKDVIVANEKTDYVKDLSGNIAIAQANKEMRANLKIFEQEQIQLHAVLHEILAGTNPGDILKLKDQCGRFETFLLHFDILEKKLAQDKVDSGLHLGDLQKNQEKHLLILEENEARFLILEKNQAGPRLDILENRFDSCSCGIGV